jgi:hypothetical protein
VVAAFAATTPAAVGSMTELHRQISDRGTTLAAHFEAHPDADIYRFLPAPGVILAGVQVSSGRPEPTHQHQVSQKLRPNLTANDRFR